MTKETSILVTNASMVRSGRLQVLDWLRALAILLVMGRHLSPCPAEVSPTLHFLTTLWERGGWIGVDLFFVLSGFLVSGLLFKELERHGEISISRFYLRRGLRIYPPFFFFLVGSTILWIAFKKPIHWKELTVDAIFLQNYIQGFWMHTWSLAVEEHFYLLLPILFFFLCRRGGRDPQSALLVIFPAVAIGCLLLRLRVASLPFSVLTHFTPTHLRIDSLLFGVLLAYLFYCRPEMFQQISRRRILLLLIAVCTFVPPFVFDLYSTPWLRTYGYSLLYIGGGSLLVLALTVKDTEAVPGRLLAWIGSHSYSLYLWHFLVAWITPAMLKLLHLDNAGWFVYAGFYFAGATVAGVLSSIILEKPVLALRDRWIPSRTLEAIPASADASGFGTPSTAEAPSSVGNG
jgi:peptidoglycan/LPS O-acetylase OafA/YrhL